MPYGVKSVATIEHFTAQITEFLLQRDVKMLIIACNTMAAVAAEVVHRLAAGIPVLDVIEAGARAAVGSLCMEDFAAPLDRFADLLVP